MVHLTTTDNKVICVYQYNDCTYRAIKQAQRGL